MRRVLICIVASMLAGCTGLPSHEATTGSSCVNDEASYACQVERYSKVNAD